MRSISSLGVCCLICASAAADTLTLPLDQRPEWLGRDGIVMAGSWEPLLFRVRRDGSPGYTPTAEQRAAYQREHSPEMVAKLKSLGVNFVMMHCYKAFGLDAERESMADAVRFAKLCHEAGLRVGVYNFSGTLGWELLFKELPQAKDWVVLDRNGKPVTYGRATYRYYWNRNHPDAQAFYRKLIRFAVQEIRTDLVHFDNYVVGPGTEPYSVKRFRDYVRTTFSPEQREQMGIKDVDAIKPVMTGPPDNVLRRAWLDFACQSLADGYHDLSRYARSLRKDILVECNPGGVGGGVRIPVDHGRLLQGGEAFWDEGREPGFRKGQLASRIRTYKVARRMDNIAFAYATSPLEMAEAMAFNLDCLGCVCWFEYDKIVARPGRKEPMSNDLAPMIRFFHKRRDLLRDAGVVADVAVLRSNPSLLFADPKVARLTSHAEQALISNRVPFQIIYEHNLGDLKRYRALILAGCQALSDGQVAQIRQFVESGGRLLMIGPVATHNEWMLPRKRPALADVAPAKIVRITDVKAAIGAIPKLLPNGLSVDVKAPPGLCAEFTRQPHRRLVHLVNYRADGPVRGVRVQMRLSTGEHVKRVTLAGPHHDADSNLPFDEQAGIATFTVPTVAVYEMASVALR